MPERASIRRRVACASLAIVVGWLPSARGQDAVPTEGHALEFATNLPWTRLALEGNEKVRGVSPLRVPGPASGEYWLVAGGAGVEAQRGRVRIRLDENGSRIAAYGGVPYTERLLRATLYPGFAQLRYRERGKGIFMALAASASLGFALKTQNDVWNAEDDRDATLRAFESTGLASEKLRLQSELADAEEDVDFATERRDLLLAAAGATWAVSYVDALLFGPRLDVSRADERSLTLGMHGKSRLDAVVRSLVFPGLGQAYNGEPRKGAWMAAGAVAAAGWALWEQDAYNESVSELRKIDVRLSHAASLPERGALVAERNRRFDRVESDYDDRNIALGLAAGAWGLAVIDAFLAHGKQWGDRHVRGSRATLGWVADPANGAVAARIHF
jgi:hypothetical protein